MTPSDFLAYASSGNEQRKRKWSARLRKQGLQFSEDIYNNTIMKVYDSLQKHNIGGSIEGYWYKAFLNNTKRECEYYYHNRDDSIDVIELLSDVPADDPPILLEDLKDGFDTLTEEEKHLFLIYNLTDITYSELEELTDIKNMKYKMNRIIGKIKKKGIPNN